MEFFTMEFWTAVLTIIITDLVLAGDNAIVIGLVASKLHPDQQKKAIIWGTVGAVIIRSSLTILVVWLLKIPGLMLVGGLLLIWIAYKLIADDKDSKNNVKAKGSLMAAIGTIILADVTMGLDNVLGVAGAANGKFELVIIGLLISIPIIVWCSTIILKFVNRYPIIIYIGSGVLGYTSSKMITGEQLFNGYFDDKPILKWGLTAVLIIGIILVGYLMKNKKQKVGKKFGKDLTVELKQK